MGTNGLDRLTKEIDALTYNARTITNALIRSTVAGGSSKGFTVTRAGNEITLDTVDIYRLYNFYREWENSGFDTDKFYSLQVSMNAVPVRNEKGIVVSRNATSNALIKHSKILYMNADNLGYIDYTIIDSTNYWLEKIRTANNPKLISNSSPIPLNLRTPIFDENMGTDKYNSLPSYLFPYAYFALDYQGYTGDNVDHQMGGNSWTIQGDSRITLNSGEIAIGDVNTSSSIKTIARRNNEYSNGSKVWSNPFTTTIGYDTHARSPFSFAGGVSSIVPGDTRDSESSIAFGKSDIASGYISLSIGGEYNSAPGILASTVGGALNTSIGDGGFIGGGEGNIVGSEIYDFTIIGAASVSECQLIVDDCVKTTGNAVGNNVIYINGNLVGQFALESTCILFDFTTRNGTVSGQHYWDVNGDAYTTQKVDIKAVRYDNTVGSSSYGYTVITLSDDVKKSGIVDGGKFAIYSVGGVIRGKNSSAFGAGCIARGVNQTVVGTYNYITVEDALIVGNGTGSDSSARYNALEVHTAGGATVYGSKHHYAEYTSAYDDFDGDADVTVFDVRTDAIRLMSGKTKIVATNDGEVFAGTFGQNNVRLINGLHVISDRLELINRDTGLLNIIGGYTLDNGGNIVALDKLYTNGNSINITTSNNIGMKALGDIKIASDNDTTISTSKQMTFKADEFIFEGSCNAFGGNADGTSISSSTGLSTTLSEINRNVSLFMNDTTYTDDVGTAVYSYARDNSYSISDMISITQPSGKYGHVLNYTGTDANNHSLQFYANKSLNRVGADVTTNLDPYQMVAVRTVHTDTTTYPDSNWGYLAWYEDIRYNGKWVTKTYGNATSNHTYYGAVNGTITNEMSSVSDYSLIFSYCITGNALSFLSTLTATSTGVGTPISNAIDGTYITMNFSTLNSQYSFEYDDSNFTTVFVRDNRMSLNMESPRLDESFIMEISPNTTADLMNIGIMLSSHNSVGSAQKTVYDYLANTDIGQTEININNPLQLQFTGSIPIKNVKNIQGRPIG